MTAPIVILSDYGMGAGTAAVKGVCKTFAPQSHVFELSSDIPALNMDAAADVLCAGMQAWPEGTVFLNLASLFWGRSLAAESCSWWACWAEQRLKRKSWALVMSSFSPVWGLPSG